MGNKLRTFFMQHKAVVGDTWGLSAALAIAGGFLFLFDLEGNFSQDRRVDLSELLILGILTGSALLYFGWRRISEQEREIRRRTDAENRASHLAHHDHLTGLPNRRSLQLALEKTIALPPSTGTMHALLLLDLNGFKAINDVHGHARGDEVLSMVAARVSETLRDGDLLARTGGDEFAMVVRNVRGCNDLSKVAERIVSALGEAITIDSDEHRVGTGVGIALIPRDGSDPGELMRKADVALYKAKGSAGSAFTFFSDKMDQERRDRTWLQRELASAIADDAIVPFYQPIVDLDTGEIRAFEALARWTHPTRGAIAPDQFIPLAEESGLIGALSDNMLRRACAEAASWPGSIDLTFNISPAMLHDKTFGLRLLGIIGAAGLPVHRLELEITERAVTNDLEAASGSLGALRDAGLRIVLDDFGTGATSLSHLRSFRFDGLKIDRRFIDLMMREEESAAIVKAIVGLAKGLGLKVVAEGIEESPQRSALKREGCRLGQGFLFGHAIPASETHRFFDAAKTSLA